MDENIPEHVEGPGRWTLIRDVAVLQLKLIVDGFRDLVLVPASLIAGVVSLVSGDGKRVGSQFYRLIGLGKQSERWIDLFGAYGNAPPSLRRGRPLSEASIDDLIGRIEAFVVDEYHRGGITAQAKERIDKALKTVQREPKNRG